MPNHDGTGPQAQPKGTREHNHCRKNGGHFHHNAMPGRRLLHRFSETSIVHNTDKIYAYSKDELIQRKLTLEQELLWINDRINEIGDPK